MHYTPQRASMRVTTTTAPTATTATKTATSRVASSSRVIRYPYPTLAPVRRHTTRVTRGHASHTA
jgi:hypothetical protein